ncbi:hypothetical protein [Alkalilimnicola sp. S0819]|uniref:hypothetical protein n=1 Tax=Alkalilimnicola sp. S0819 TaxID=2613922 RepID=UPI001262133C|nr:hypothetical protein [Alkalilimnicola sp. S0819]KAB7622622.1 hypothetical protein F3N43_12185 [Alkalilimnicola sp. S0819]MPQ17393.1 hypothetical protein [Alkalilimnicola sp. S0819]
MFNLKFSWLLVVCLGLVGCGTKVIPVTLPEASEAAVTKGYVRISAIDDYRNFRRSPSSPYTPSIEGDDIDNPEKRRKSIGRMRHGTYQYALWNFSFVGDEDIFGACRKIVSNSLSSAGYHVVSPDHAEYDSAIPVTIEVLEFWAWMQPKFNIDVSFDSKLRVRSELPEGGLDVTASGRHTFSTAYAGLDAWTKVVKIGVENLHRDMLAKLGGEIREQAEKHQGN